MDPRTLLGRFAHVILTVTLSMSAAEFYALQQLPDEARRVQLGLPVSCAPALTAINPDPSNAARLTVSADCRSGQSVSPREPRPPRVRPDR
jgi:hypothetical protein